LSRRWTAEILVPGEIEARTAAVRRVDGINPDETTWQLLVELGGR
jgi:LDH2 family malate/lactate/ureidoglycolate dehydrogenase